MERQVRALTLAEVVIAIALLGILLTSTLLLFTTLVGASNKSSHQSTGAYLAQTKLEECIRLNMYDPVPPQLSVGLYSADKNQTTDFWYKLTTTPIAPQPGLYPRAHLIEVEVWWWNKAHPGQGRLSTHLSRLHYKP